MPRKKTTLFIDGSNCYHALKSNNMLETFSYKQLFDELSKQFDITKVYFYDAIKNFDIEPEQFSKQQRFHEKLRKEMPSITIQTRKLRYLGVNNRAEEAKKNSGFCKSCIHKVDGFLKNAGLSKISKEKGVDIMLVTDMIRGAFQERYEIALLATGDADFVPAVTLVQTLKKEVINVHFYAGSSAELRNVCNYHLLIQTDAAGNCYFK